LAAVRFDGFAARSLAAGFDLGIRRRVIFGMFRVY
jgi:hypothetical protein